MNYVGNGPAPSGLVLVGDTNPIGMIGYFHAPPNASWVQLNGQALLKASYPDLWTWAQGFLTADQVANPGLYKSIDGATFAVPKLDGTFVRSTGQIDANHVASALGVLQADAVGPHVHTQGATAGTGVNSGVNVPYAAGVTNTGNPTPATTETRPANVALVPCVKALRTLLMPASGGVASQADQEAAAALDKLVTPGAQKFHPSAAKVFCAFDLSGVVARAFNVSSVTDTGTGDWTVNFTTPFSDANYTVAFQMTTVVPIAAGTSLTTLTTPHSKLAGSARVWGHGYTGTTNNAFVSEGGTSNNFIAFGDQP